LLSILLIGIFGIHGAALGTLAAVLLVEAAVILPRACRHSDVSALSFFKTVVWPSLPAALPMLACAFVLDQWLATDNFGLLCFKVATCGIVYLTGFYFTGLSAAERSLLTSKLLRTAPVVQLESK
jgi:O-antigen/teichoic acid export membrane protein